MSPLPALPISRRPETCRNLGDLLAALLAECGFDEGERAIVAETLAQARPKLRKRGSSQVPRSERD